MSRRKIGIMTSNKSQNQEQNQARETSKSQEKPKHTGIEEIGEFGLIDKMNAMLPITRKETIMGIGDDAALIQTPSAYTVISTDLLMEGVHFDLSYTPLTHLGYKAIAVNVSDIAAMNAIPTHITVGLALSNRFSVEAIEALYQGIHLACKQYNVDVIGGDTTSSKAGLGIAITVFGQSDPATVTRRKGSQKNEILCVTGDLAGAYMGLQVLEREKVEFLANPNMQPKIEKYTAVVQKQLKPEARMDIVHELKELGIVPTTMIDISDGLASELFHLAKQNNLGVHIFEDKIPISKETFDVIAEFNLSPMTCALNGGEDYELLFSIKQDDLQAIEKMADVSVIGYFTENKDEKVLVNNQGHPIALKAQGWDHFS